MPRRWYRRPRSATWTWGCSVLKCATATHSSEVWRSDSMRLITSRVSRCKSRRSPNSGENQLPQPWIGAILPSRSCEAISTPVASAPKPHFSGLERSTLPRDVSAVCAPMACNPIAGIAYPDRTVLKMGRSRPCRLLSPPRPRTSGVFHDCPEGNGHGWRTTAALSGSEVSPAGAETSDCRRHSSGTRFTSSESAA